MITGRVQFYGYDKAGTRRIFSFKVTSKQMAIDALTRMNIPAGWYKPNEDRHSSEKISNPYYQKSQAPNIWDKLDAFLKL